MAEPFGLALGFAGLVGVFTACVDCFKMVQVYQKRGPDFDILQTMLDNQQFHFMAWGRACGFMDLERPDLQIRFDDPSSQEKNGRIHQTMGMLHSLLKDGNKLKSKYGLKSLGATPKAPTPERNTPIPSPFEKVFQTSTGFWNTALQRKTLVVGSVRWAIGDKDKFSCLIQDIRNLNSDLTRLTEEYGVSQSKHWILKYEMENIEDKNSLEVITEVNSGAGEDDIISVAASRQSHRIREHSVVHAQDLLKPNDSLSVYDRQAVNMADEFEEDLDIGPQPIGIKRILPRQWRNVKTRQGLFSYLEILMVATSANASTDTSKSIPSEEEGTKEWGFLRRVSNLHDDHPDPSGVTTSRVAINSKVLLKALAKITGREIPESKNVLVHPFKYLVVYEERIRKALRETELHCAPVAHEEASSDFSEDDSRSRLDLETVTGTAAANNSTPEPQAEWNRIRDELRCLVSLMDTDLAGIFEVKRMVEQYAISDILFEHLWLLYIPGRFVLSGNSREGRWNVQAYLVLHVTGGRRILDRGDGLGGSEAPGVAHQSGDVRDEREFTDASHAVTPLVIDCFYLDTDGHTIGPRPKRFIISPYLGVRSIDSLPIRPASLAELDKEDLSSRGKVFIRANQEQFRNYSGPTLSEPDDGTPRTLQALLLEISGQIMIDTAEALRHFEREGCSWRVVFTGGILSRPTKYDSRECFEPLDRETRRKTDIFDDACIDIQRRLSLKQLLNRRSLLNDTKRLTDEELILLPQRVHGFVLSTRKWASFSLEFASVPERDAMALDSVVLSDFQKRLVRTVTATLEVEDKRIGGNHFTTSNPLTKGRGHVILLHGASGTGKTLLVEAIASQFNRPLFRVPGNFILSFNQGSQLGISFALMKRWRCILLIEGAEGLRTYDDYQVRKTTWSDRALAFITMPRLTVVNTSFSNYLSLLIEFRPLEADDKKLIWKNFVRRAEGDFEIDEGKLMAEEYLNSVADLNCNGQKIRQIWLMATALASAERREFDIRPKLLPRHFKTLLDADSAFQVFVRKDRGED
ncbi:MAG: hypothetical protein M1820_002348 [Bogoriella megaspora]|nr:MAG: hypothetical protein M1820_002348 [Bogoriella megaspora]